MDWYANPQQSIPYGFLADQQGADVAKRPLNFQRLLDAGVFRVTNQGLSGPNYNPDPSAGFSLVSKWNDSFSDNGTSKWPNNPSAYPVVMDMFHNRPEDIGAHKYMQIIQSAISAGLKPEEIYYQPNSQPVGLLGSGQ